LAAATTRGWQAYRRDSIAVARAAFSAALRGCPSDNDAAVGLGFVALREGQVDDAQRHFAAVIARDSANADAWDGLSATANRKGDVAGAVRAAKRVVALDPRNASARALLNRLAPDWDRTTGPPVRHRAAELDLTARTVGEHFELRVGSEWRPFFLKGVNMGVAMPGKFPAEFPMDSALYAGWLDTIAAMHANTLRIYTILPPSFYRAVRAWNIGHPDRVLYLVHGVWTELPPDNNFDDAGFNAEYKAEIRRVVDLLHGAADFSPKPGHAGGRYDADVSPWVVAYIIGREWEPYSVVLYNQRVKEQRSLAGRFLTIGKASATDVWMTAQCDFMLSYEFDTYNALRPIAYTNWPTTDPITHPSETSYDQQMKFRGLKYDRPDDGLPPHEEDGPSLDASLVHPTAANTAGWFASYHVYPYYPDFILYDSAYTVAKSSFGRSNYFGYLRDLQRHHAGIPLVIAEFGVPTSRGNAHLQPQGWSHGGLNEVEAAAINARLAAEIREAGAAGEMFFAWIDEWFKRNWFSADFELPRENARNWHNALSPEQHYGIMALLAGAPGTTPELGADAGRWRALQVLQRGPLLGRDSAALRVGNDEAYVYLALEFPTLRGRPFPFATTRLQIAMDTYRPDLGQVVLPVSGLRSSAGFEFLLEVNDTTDAQLKIVPDYNPYMPQRLVEGGAFFGEHFRRPILSVRRYDGVFDSLFALTNRPRFTGDGMQIRGRGINIGRLRFGTLAANTLADWYWDAAAGLLEFRLPWGMLNVSDPSSGAILFESDVERALHPSDTGPGSQLVGKPSDGFRFGVVALRPGPDVVGTIPSLNAYGNWQSDAFVTWKWKTWDTPTFHAHLKPVYEALQRLWAAP
jgi:tetratricopeptide (TPR) repeat protein